MVSQVPCPRCCPVLPIFCLCSDLNRVEGLRWHNLISVYYVINWFQGCWWLMAVGVIRPSYFILMERYATVALSRGWIIPEPSAPVPSSGSFLPWRAASRPLCASGCSGASPSCSAHAAGQHQGRLPDMLYMYTSTCPCLFSTPKQHIILKRYFNWLVLWTDEQEHNTVN